MLKPKVKIIITQMKNQLFKCDKKYIENIEIDTASIINNDFYEYNSLLFGDENYSGDKDLLTDYINSSKTVSKKLLKPLSRQ